MKRRNLEYTEKVIRSKGHSQQQTMITYGVDVGYWTQVTIVEFHLWMYTIIFVRLETIAVEMTCSLINVLFFLCINPGTWVDHSGFTAWGGSFKVSVLTAGLKMIGETGLCI